MEIGKFHIPANAGPYACHKDLVFSTSVTGHGLDVAVDFLAAFPGVCQEECKGIVLAFHRHTFTAVCLHYRRINLHAVRFLNSAACMDDKGAILSG